MTRSHRISEYGLNNLKKLRLQGRNPGQVYSNSIDAFIPELWASESLMILVENMIGAALVYRDFEDTLANYGDVVNTRRPAVFTAQRKDVNDNVVVQDATATNIQVPLNQHIHTSFLIRDGEESKSFVDLVNQYLRPAMIAQARYADKLVLGRYVDFLSNAQGGAGGAFNTNTALASLLNTRQAMNITKAPISGRKLILNPTTETTLLNLQLFIQANTVGDQGQALQNAALGRKMGFDMYMDQNMPSVLGGAAYLGVNGDTLAADALAGATTVTLTTGTAGNFPVGGWVTIVGDDVPRKITAFNSGTKVLTLASPLNAKVTSGAAVNAVANGTVNMSGGYAAGYDKDITIAGITLPLQVGQMVNFAGDSTNYTVMQVNSATDIVLDMPLVNPLTNSQAVFPGPAGNYNLAFTRDAIALVVRPLARPRAGTGALSAVVNDFDLSMRATITYDGNKQGHLVTLDFLCGIATLNPALGAVMVG